MVNVPHIFSMNVSNGAHVFYSVLMFDSNLCSNSEVWHGTTFSFALATYGDIPCPLPLDVISNWPRTSLLKIKLEFSLC